jgi:DNA helicase-2/ATP-dependent DNA helicase PcrA
MDLILEQTGYHDYIDDDTEEGRDRWANVMELRAVAALAEDADLTEFLEQVSLVSDVDNLEEEVVAPTLLTLHAAKGLEFPVVFITGLEDGVLPHSRSLDEMEELAEERRLFYVGLTRAKDQVYLFHTFRRTFFGESSVGTPSRFLSDIPDALVSGGSAAQRREESVGRASSWQWQQPSPARAVRRKGRVYSRPHRESSAAAPEAESVGDEPRYHSGQKVHHSKFGEGIVVDSKVTGDDEEVTVAFTSGEIKRLAASFANLETVKK